MKKVAEIRNRLRSHWVGNGFPVRTMFSVHEDGDLFSPFILLDHGGPAEFPPDGEQRGVGEHPHRGFETVTVVYSGDLEHRDSAGNSGRIGSGEVQWMTAASGVVHEEFHSRSFSESGGTLEMVQLWVNLPAAEKMGAPRYQDLTREKIPAVKLSEKGSSARVIAGRLFDAVGPALTFTPVSLWDLRIREGDRLELPVAEGHNTAILVLEGQLQFSADESAGAGELVRFERSGLSIGFTAARDTKALLLGGQPIDEPVVAYGPFVMNSPEEIRQAFADYQAGRMGRLD